MLFAGLLALAGLFLRTEGRAYAFASAERMVETWPSSSSASRPAEGTSRAEPARTGRQAGQNKVSRTRRGRYPVGPSCASSPSMSTSIAPKMLMFSLCAGEM